MSGGLVGTCIDGRLVAPAVAAVPVTDHGFLYGDSVFETFRTYGRVPHALDRHLARLERSAASVGLTLPLEAAQWRAEIRQLVDSIAESDAAEVRIRLVVTRGDGAGLGVDSSARRVLLAYRFEPHPEERYVEGVGVRLVRGGRYLASAKAGSYLLSVLATREAHEHGDHEAILVDEGGQVREGATSNVFAVVGGVLRTPGSGVLPGVTRGIVLELAEREGLTVGEGPLTEEELRGASECFLTSATRELMPIARIDGATQPTARPVWRALHARYLSTLPERLA